MRILVLAVARFLMQNGSPESRVLADVPRHSPTKASPERTPLHGVVAPTRDARAESHPAVAARADSQSASKRFARVSSVDRLGDHPVVLLSRLTSAMSSLRSLSRRRFASTATVSR